MNFTWHYLYRFPRRLRVVVCRILLLTAGFGFGLLYYGNSAAGYTGGACMAVWSVIPERDKPSDPGL